MSNRIEKVMEEIVGKAYETGFLAGQREIERKQEGEPYEEVVQSRNKFLSIWRRHYEEQSR